MITINIQQITGASIMVIPGAEGYAEFSTVKVAVEDGSDCKLFVPPGPGHALKAQAIADAINAAIAAPVAMAAE